MSKNHPIAKARDGLLEVAVFENENAEGKKYLSYSHSRSYRDGDVWKKTTSLTGTQPLAVAQLYEKAYTMGLEHRQQQNQAIAPTPARSNGRNHDQFHEQEM